MVSLTTQEAKDVTRFASPAAAAVVTDQLAASGGVHAIARARQVKRGAAAPAAPLAARLRGIPGVQGVVVVRAEPRLTIPGAFHNLGTFPGGGAPTPVSAGVVSCAQLAAVRSCVRRGAAIDLILDRGRENRSQLVFTTARGRDAVFWQSPRTRKQARPDVRTPTARAAGISDLEIIADSHEQYPYRFGGQQATVLRRALPCGDYGVLFDGRLAASVERKSLADLVASLTSGKLRYALAEMAALPRAAVVVEDRYSAIFKLDLVPARAGRRRPGGSPGPLAERADRLLRDPATR